MKDKKITVGVYARVSTGDQSVDRQVMEIRDYMEKRGWCHCLVFQDHQSGTSNKRPGFQQLLRAARKREIDLIICQKLDRLFRSLKDLVVTLEELDHLGIGFISIKDSLDLTTPNGRLMMHMIGAFAEFEAELIRERVKSGLDMARRKGRKLGRPRKVDKDMLLILKQTGLSTLEIAKQLKVSARSVQRYLRA